MTQDHGLMVRDLVRISCDEVRKPLWALKAATEVLTKSTRLSPREQEIVSLIARNAQRVDATFRLLLDCAGAVTGDAMPLTRERCSISELAEEAIAVARSYFPGRTFLGMSASGSGEWDRGRMVRLLTGLLAHADEYGAPGAGAHLSWEATGGAVVFVVAIAPVSRGADTVGLRLAIAQEIAREHGGELEVKLEHSGRLSILARLPRAT
jgi:signal transduction histidine kinase